MEPESCWLLSSVLKHTQPGVDLGGVGFLFHPHLLSARSLSSGDADTKSRWRGESVWFLIVGGKFSDGATQTVSCVRSRTGTRTAAGDWAEYWTRREGNLWRWIMCSSCRAWQELIFLMIRATLFTSIRYITNHLIDPRRLHSHTYTQPLLVCVCSYFTSIIWVFSAAFYLIFCT